MLVSEIRVLIIRIKNPKDTSFVDHTAEVMNIEAQNMSEQLKNHFGRKFYSLDSDKNWYVGFLKLSSKHIEEIKEYLKSLGYIEWAQRTNTDASNYFFAVEEMTDEEGLRCSYNSGCCSECEFSAKEFCRLACAYA